MKKHLFVFGMGYSAQELARRLLAEGWMVSGTVRSDEKGMALHRAGMRAWRFNDETLLPVAALDGVTHVINSVPPEMAGDPVFDRHRERLCVLPGLEWFAYLSTTGVYGDTQGEWVDESAPTPPTHTRSQRRIDAEQIARLQRLGVSEADLPNALDNDSGAQRRAVHVPEDMPPENWDADEDYQLKRAMDFLRQGTVAERLRQRAG